MMPATWQNGFSSVNFVFSVANAALTGNFGA